MHGVVAAQLDQICRRLGEVDLHPELWPQIISEIAEAVGAVGGVLLQSDVRTTDVPRTESVDEIARMYFRDGWHLRDAIAARAVPLALRGKMVVTDREIISSEEARRLPDLNELYLPFGIRWHAVVSFRVGDALWGLPLLRALHRGPYEADEARILEILPQRLNEVASLSAAVGRIALSAATSALDAVRQPAAAIDRLGRVVDANPAAVALFGPHLHVRDRRLVTSDQEAQRSLQTLMDRLRTTPDVVPLPCDPFVIRRTGAGPLVVRVLPVHGAARTPFLGARVILTFTVLEPGPRPNVAMLAKAFGLTPAEARLAAVMAEGSNPEGAAEVLGVSRTTVRNQLKAIFAKTGAHRQSELVALLARL